MGGQPYGGSEPREISIFVNVPFCRQRCAYCRVYSVCGRESSLDAFLDALAREWALVREEEGLEHGAARVVSVQIGGGTPSLLGAPRLARILEILHAGPVWNEGSEVSLETHPDTVSREMAADTLRAGYNRLRVAVHSFHEDELHTLGRGHTAQQSRGALEALRAGGCQNLAIDLLHGLPGQKLSDWEASLALAVEFRCEHVTPRVLTPREETVHERLLRGGFTTSILDEALFEQSRSANRILSEAGYEQYLVANYARHGFASLFELRTAHRAPCIGLGPGAYSFDGNWRWRNLPDLDGYLANVIERGQRPERERYHLSAENHAQELLLLGLRLAEGIAWAQLERWVAGETALRVRRRAQFLAAHGFVQLTSDGARLAPQAYVVADSVALELMRALQERAE